MPSQTKAVAKGVGREHVLTAIAEVLDRVPADWVVVAFDWANFPSP
jgi:hypothetical protein